MTTKPRDRPSLPLLAATLLPAAYVWVSIGRAVPARLDYPSLCLRDPVQLLFLYGEHLRLSCMDEPQPKVQAAKQLFFDATEELKEELASYKRIAPRGGAARERRVLDDLGALMVVATGWAGGPARERLAQDLSDAVPDYVKPRIKEMVESGADRSQERATKIRRYERGRRWFDWFKIGLAAPATILLYVRRKRRSPLASGPVAVELVWGLVLWIWCEAAVKLVSIATGRDVPILAGLHPVSTLVAIPFVLALIRSAWGRGPETPLARMLSLPATRNALLNGTLWTLLGLAASTVATLGVLAAAHPLGLRRVWSEGMLEPLLIGTRWEAVGIVSSMLVGAPFLEEILYRGLLFGGLARPLGLKWATLASSLVFAAVHGYGFTSSLIVALHGVIYALVYVRTRSLWPAMLLHALTNLAACLDDYSLLL